MTKDESFVKKHNRKIKIFRNSRKIKQENQVYKNKIKFIEQVNTKASIIIIQKNKDIMKKLISFIIGFGINSIFHMQIINIKIRKARSRYLLHWLANILTVIGKLQKIAKRVRKRMAHKNIIGVSTPFLKFIYNKRVKYFNTVKKVVNRIQKMNLIFLLMHRWINNIKLIQLRFRSYLEIKKYRTRAVLKMCEDYAKNSEKHWNGYNLMRKIRAIEEFLIGKTVKYSQQCCRYFKDLGYYNRFNRSYGIMAGAVYSGLNGRSVMFGNIKKPIFLLFSKKEEIYEFVDKCIKVVEKSKNKKKHKISKKIIRK